MPELPEVETTLRGVSAHILDTAILQVNIRNPNLRWPIPAQLAQSLKQQHFTRIRRRAKYLLLSTARGTLIIHLGMSGSLRIVPHNTPYDKHDHFELCFANDRALRLKDPRRFGAVLWTEDNIEKHPLLAHLGPEPLAPEFNAGYLFQRSRGRKTNIKQFIMDSKVVVGIGNIYANEALFASSINPKRAAGRISRARYEELCQNVRKILTEAIRQGGTTLKDFTGGDGKPGYFKQKLQVYGRKNQPCIQCGHTLREIRLNNRSTVYCTHCQK